MTDPDATSLSLLSSAIAGVVAQATPAIVSVHSHRSRASGFVWRPNLVVTPDQTFGWKRSASQDRRTRSHDRRRVAAARHPGRRQEYHADPAFAGRPDARFALDGRCGGARPTYGRAGHGVIGGRPLAKPSWRR